MSDTRISSDRDAPGHERLPAQLTRLIGREGELADLSALLWRTHLLTLCGPGGAGKTRLALALAELVRAEGIGGARWVDLSSITDPSRVADTACCTGADASLLVLDNCEHVGAACAQLIADLRGRSPALRVLATSREPLGVPGEQLWRVTGLATGPREAAVELFLERAREASTSFHPEACSAHEAAVRICALLDGLPLAIELAASRAEILGAEEIAARLERDSAFLRHRGRAVPARHRTLQSNLDWSYQMLASAERRLLMRLSTFAGSFSLQAAEHIGADSTHQQDDVLALLSSLIDRSLVEVVHQGESRRYRLLETVRRYARDKLDEAGEGSSMRERHARYFAELASVGPPSDALVREHENLIHALDWLVANAPASRLEAGAALRLVGAKAALARSDLHAAAEHASACIEPGNEHTDRALRAAALLVLSQVAAAHGGYEQARELCTASIETHEQVANAKTQLAAIELLSGSPEAAESLGVEALEQSLTEPHRQVEALVTTAAAACHRNRLDTAQGRLEDALRIARERGFHADSARSLHRLADVARRRRRPLHERARLLRESLLLFDGLGERIGVATVLEASAAWVLLACDAQLAVALMARARRLRVDLEAPVPAIDEAEHRASWARLEGSLTRTAFAAAASAGHELQLQCAIRQALDALEQLEHGAGASPEQQPALTPRELAVLELISSGQTNREIASDLQISPSTAGVHVSNILRKLAVTRRVEVSARARTLKLLAAA